MVPDIEYYTHINLSDTLQIKEENELVHSYVCSKFKGIDEKRKHIFYKAFSAIPDGKTPINTYGFLKELPN